MTLYEEYCQSERKTITVVCIGGASDGRRVRLRNEMEYLALPGLVKYEDFLIPIPIEHYTPRRFVIGKQYITFYALASISDMEAFDMLLESYKQGEQKCG